MSVGQQEKHVCAAFGKQNVCAKADAFKQAVKLHHAVFTERERTFFIIVERPKLFQAAEKGSPVCKRVAFLAKQLMKLI